ncbi:uncharacterized protein LOC117110744 [Anneissia japonica]|uniref:uncharacterized protein LOC117110744 n=1 Tax=Anneissia japonica TaxID=1529436 RepID=UPI00142565E6|nr:uncharacterized protein LOC117110744 [Anneissia japonica]
MEFNKLINMLLCFVIYTSQSWTVSSISLVSGPKDARVVLGAEVIFTCNVTKISTYYIVWDRFVNDEWIIISEGEDIQLENAQSTYTIVPGTNDLEISNVQLTDTGRYECNYARSSEKYYYNFQPIRATATLTILQPPSARSPLCSLTRDRINVTSETQFYVGESIGFKCSSEGHGNTSPSLNITESGVDVTEYVYEDVDSKHVESIELKIDENTDFICYLRSEALSQPRVCRIKPIALLPQVEIEPKIASVLEYTDVSFQCSGSGFKTHPLHFDWQISPYFPGDVVNSTTSILKITNLWQNKTMFDSSFIITCFVREGQMVWNSSSKLLISMQKKNNNINNNRPETLVIGIIIAIVLTTVILAGLFRWRNRKLPNNTCERHLDSGILNNEQPYSVVQNQKTNVHDQYSENTGLPNASKFEMNAPQCLNVPVGHNESAVYYSTIPAENNQESDNNYDNIGHNKEGLKNEPLYENEGFTSDITELNAERLNYADLDLEMVASRDIIDNEPKTTYSTVTMETR